MLTQKLVVDNSNLLSRIASQIKIDYGSVYSPAKVANLFKISPDEAEIFLDQLVDDKIIKRLDFVEIGTDLNLYFCDKPNIL